MHCPGCGKIIPGQIRYCPYCGTPVRPKRNGALRWRLIMTVTSLVAMAIFGALRGLGISTLSPPTPPAISPQNAHNVLDVAGTYDRPLPHTVLDPRSSSITLVADVDALLAPGGPEKARAVEQLRAQLRERIALIGLRKAGIVLTFGVSPDPLEGNRIAREVNRVLLETFPEIFETAILRDYHTIDPNRANRGNVELEIYFLLETPR